MPIKPGIIKLVLKDSQQVIKYAEHTWHYKTREIIY